MRQLLTTARHLSLDVVVGALLSGAMVAQWLQQTMPLSWWVSLPLSVWVIYTADHLLDAHQLQDQAHTPRHRFHHQHRRPLQLVWGLGLLFCVTIVPFWVPRVMLWFGVGMGGLVLGHLALVQCAAGRSGWLWQKELGVALIYSLGVWGGPLSLQGDWLDLHLWTGYFQFLLLAQINLLIFSWYEERTDELDAQTSLVRGIGATQSLWLIRGLALLTVALGIWRLIVDSSGGQLAVQLIYLLMLLTLLGVIGFPEFYRQRERYRYVADGAFWLPGLYPLFICCL